MSNTTKKIKVSWTFEFDPYGEHDFLFEGKPLEEIVKDCERMAIDDIFSLANSGDLDRALSVEITE